MSPTQTNEAKFFDLHTTGIGYLNRIREIQPRGKGRPIVSVVVAALHGSCDDTEYTYIDCNVVGTEAEHLIRRCQKAVDAGKKVLVSFRIGDIWADAFTYMKGEKKGQPGASIKGRLLFISWIKVDGELVHQAKPKDSTESLPEQASGEGGNNSDNDPDPADAEMRQSA
jgi:hypothetical protein